MRCAQTHHGPMYRTKSAWRREAMKRHVLAVLAYVVATFITQATSHFGINAGHYAAVNYMRKDTIFPLGILTMLIQGAVLSYLYARTAGPKISLSVTIPFP